MLRIIDLLEERNEIRITLCVKPSDLLRLARMFSKCEQALFSHRAQKWEEKRALRDRRAAKRALIGWRVERMARKSRTSIQQAALALYGDEASCLQQVTALGEAARGNLMHRARLMRDSAIRRRVAEGVKYDEIAGLYKVTKGRISQIVKNAEPHRKTQAAHRGTYLWSLFNENPWIN